MRRYAFINMIVVIGALIAGLFFCELTCRIVFDPVDYLQPILIEDPILGLRVAPHSAGHDAWGFRNAAVPDETDIVAIGDSQTYGVSSPSRESWPAQLASMTGKKVYNCALGGFGPAQYTYILENYALRLKPSYIIVGFYVGNDVFDTYRSVYRLDYWSQFRDSRIDASRQTSSRDASNTNVKHDQYFRGIRGWLSEYSIFYRFVTHSALGDIARNFESAVLRAKQKDYIILRDVNRNLRTVVRPHNRIRGIRIDDKNIQEGILLSCLFLSDMFERCTEEGIRFLVVILPTKEYAFLDSITDDPALRSNEMIKSLIENEEDVVGWIKAYMDEHGIPYIDTSSALRTGIKRGAQLYPTNHDNHPNKDGYAVIARVITQILQQ